LEKEVEIRELRDSDIDDVSRLHTDNLREGLLFHLGEEMICLFHRGIISSKTGFSYVALHAGRIVGVVAASTQPGKIMPQVCRKNLFRVLDILIIRSALNPKLIPWILQTLAIGRKKRPEIMFLIVDRKVTRKGIGFKLMTKALEELRKRSVEEVYVEANKDNPATAFYEKNGFNKQTEYRIYGKTRAVYKFLL